MSIEEKATDAERLESLEAENARLRCVLLECADLLSKTPPVCNDVYVGKKLEIRFGVEAAKLSNIARNALKEGE